MVTGTITNEKPERVGILKSAPTNGFIDGFVNVKGDTDCGEPTENCHPALQFPSWTV